MFCINVLWFKFRLISRYNMKCQLLRSNFIFRPLMLKPTSSYKGFIWSKPANYHVSFSFQGTKHTIYKINDRSMVSVSFNGAMPFKDDYDGQDDHSISFFWESIHERIFQGGTAFVAPQVSNQDQSHQPKDKCSLYTTLFLEPSLSYCLCSVCCQNNSKIDPQMR